CGKTTNLNTIYAKTSQKARGEMVSLNTETDRTLFFDLLPMDVGVVGGFRCKLQLYTVPGQVFYNSTRKLVLKGVDGIVFVADSQTPMLDANKESLQNLVDNLKELGLDLGQIPMVFQWNKRDLKNVVPVDQLEAELNPKHLPSFQSVASDGTGVFETLRGVTKLALGHIKQHHFQETGSHEAPEPPHRPDPLPPAPPPPPPPPPPVPERHHPSHPTPAAPLGFADLPSVGDLLEDEGFGAPPEPAASAAVPVPLMPSDLVPPAFREPQGPAASSLPPLHPPAPLAPPKPIPAPRPVPHPAPRPMTPLAPLPLAPRLAAPALPKLKAMPSPKPALDLRPSVGLGPSSPAPSLKVQLPADLGAEGIEVAVLVRQNGRIVGEALLQRSAPAPGGAVRLSVELKRS
ncbi:MAG TPA: GTPase domain-containing protein, partial [Holophaga sp.]|nr:GTPase domain-containing protein [Holophaga sp.]